MLATLATLWILYAVAMVTPGANILLVAQLAASGDARGARFAASGIAIGACLWSSAAMAGVSAVFNWFPAVRTALQVAGAAYLLYMAVQLVRSTAPGLAQVPALSAVQGVRAGVMTSLSNPKAVVFFGSIFSAALPADPDLLLTLSAVALVTANAIAWYLFVAVLFSRPTVQRGYAMHRTLLARATGGLLGSLGLALLWQALPATRP